MRVLRASESILGAMNQNLRSAVLTVLPLLPPKFTDRQLFLVGTEGVFDVGDHWTELQWRHPHVLR